MSGPPPAPADLPDAARVTRSARRCSLGTSVQEMVWSSDPPVPEDERVDAVRDGVQIGAPWSSAGAGRRRRTPPRLLQASPRGAPAAARRTRRGSRPDRGTDRSRVSGRAHPRRSRPRRRRGRRRARPPRAAGTRPGGAVHVDRLLSTGLPRVPRPQCARTRGRGTSHLGHRAGSPSSASTGAPGAVRGRTDARVGTPPPAPSVPAVAGVLAAGTDADRRRPRRTP